MGDGTMQDRIDEFKTKLRSELERRGILYDTVAHYRNLKGQHVFWVHLIIPGGELGGTCGRDVELDSLDDLREMEHLARDCYRSAKTWGGLAECARKLEANS